MVVGCTVSRVHNYHACDYTQAQYEVNSTRPESLLRIGRIATARSLYIVFRLSGQQQIRKTLGSLSMRNAGDKQVITVG